MRHSQIAENFERSLCKELKQIFKNVVKYIVLTIRGTAECIGMLVMFVYIAGKTVTGEWALGSLINGSISSNGIPLTVMLIFVMFLLGGVYKNEFDKELR